MASDPVSGLMAAVDGFARGVGVAAARHRAVVSAIALPILVGAVGLAFVPVRSEIGSQNVALVLAAATIAVALSAGAVPAVLSGLSSALVFAVYLTEPYGELDITARHDEITTVLLVGFAVALALVRRRILALLERTRRQEVDLRLLSVGARDVLSGGPDETGGGSEASLAALADLLRARSCELGDRPGADVPRLATNTLIVGTPGVGSRTASVDDLPLLAIDISDSEALILRDVAVGRVDVSERLAALGLAALIASRRSRREESRRSSRGSPP